MNLSSLKDHSWYSPMANQFVVLFDGEKRHFVTVASEEEGWIEFLADGQPVRLTGQVEILVKPQAARFITPNFLRVAEWLTTAGKEVGSNADMSVQVGCMLEEVGEFIEQLEIEAGSQSKSVALDTGFAAEHLGIGLSHIQALAQYLKAGEVSVSFLDPIAALDALCDIDVTINGVAFLAGWNKLKADVLVLEANDKKFVDGQPVILPGGKIGKRPDWQPADLSECVQSAPTPA